MSTPNNKPALYTGLGHYQLTSGSRHLGEFTSFTEAAARAVRLTQHDWLDQAIWSPAGELLAVVKDGELHAIGFTLATADTSEGPASELPAGWVDLDAI